MTLIIPSVFEFKVLVYSVLNSQWYEYYRDSYVEALELYNSYKDKLGMHIFIEAKHSGNTSLMSYTFIGTIQ